MKLASRINIAMVLVGIIPLVLFTTFAMGWLHESMRQSSRQALQSLAAQTAREVDAVLRNGVDAVSFLAKHSAVTAPASTHDLHATLSAFSAHHASLREIRRIDFTDTDRTASGTNDAPAWPPMPGLKDVHRGHLVLSDVQPRLKPFEPFMTVAAPVIDADGQIRTALVGRFDMSVFDRIMTSVFPAQGQALILDQRGFIVSTSGGGQILSTYSVDDVARAARRGRADIVEFIDDSRTMVAAIYPTTEHSWSICLIRPAQVLDAATLELRQGLFIALGLTLTALLLLGLFFSRHISGRLRLVFTAAETLRRGGSVALDKLGSDEIGDMARTLSRISMELQESRQQLLAQQQTLEHEVRQRSLALRLANQDLQQEVSERTLAQRNLAEKQAELEHILRTAPVGIALCRNFRLQNPNAHMQRITGYSLEELDNMPIAWLMPDFQDFLRLKTGMEDLDATGGKPVQPGSLECMWRHSDGSTIHVLLCFSSSGSQWILSVMDISTRKTMEEKLRHMAMHDDLTGLGNRLLCRDRLRNILARTRRDPKHRFALVFVDLDRFKVINDSQGHAVGDKLLKLVADRLAAGIRESDTVCRFGGDEFLILLDGLDSPGNAVAIARRLQEDLRQTYRIEDREFKISASLGIYIGEQDDADADQIVQRGNVAMHWAKENGRNCFKVFTKRLMSQAVDLMSLENDLRHAVGRGQLFLEYQPIIQTDGCLFGFEALVRWLHPAQGRIAPDRFIPVAEETGIIHALGDWVLNQACATMAAWNMETGENLTISVNISGRQFGLAHLPVKIQAALDQSGLPPACLKLEITESSLMKHLTRPQEILERLRQMGVSLSVDDFGTGYSSLAYLRRLPLDYLKIDRSFVRDLHANAESEAIVRAVIQLGQTLGMEIIAEGVETKDHLEKLRNMGCDLYQGFYIARPLSAEKALDFIRQTQPSCQKNPDD